MAERGDIGRPCGIPGYVIPRLSAPAPDPSGAGPTVYDTGPLGYVASEWLMSGTAPTYEPVHEGDMTIPPARPGVAPDPMGGEIGGPASGPPPDMPGLPHYVPSDFSRRPILSVEPYTTRLIIYQPRDMDRFSGNVIIETIHPTRGGTTSMWAEVNRFLASRGDVFAAVQHPRTLAWLSHHWPGRYGALSCDDFTQIWGMLADTARLLKEGGAASPIGTPARRAYLTGYSFTGLIATSFAKQHHDVNRMPGGAPLFDGYPIGTGFGPIPPLDVPMMVGANQYRAYNDTDEERQSTSPSSASRPVRAGFDADGPVSRRRRYEIVGFQHTPGAPTKPGGPVPPAGLNASPLDVRCAHQWPPGAVRNPNVLGRAVYEGMFRNIADWVDRGIAPPRAALIETADGGPRLDEYGNPLGGLRMPDITVPVARYETGDKECALTGWIIPFPPERLRRVYGNRASYLRRYEAATDAMVEARFILPERGAQLIRAAREHIPGF